MIQRHPVSTLTYTLFPYTTLGRSAAVRQQQIGPILAIARLVARPAVGIGRRAAIDDRQLDLPPRHARHAEVEPLVEVALPVLDDLQFGADAGGGVGDGKDANRSEEHTSELQSLMRISYAVFCLKKKQQQDDRP